ncbi:PH domain-containing protein [Leucobacter musarum]|uniref:PH domain-containing protein n=1 Tax=Leucobacter musarum TaxID=1930747 RepID=UPI000949AE54|nr:PH domain-containing protein [Leucobacter musarum]
MSARRSQSLTSEVESVLGPAPTDYAQPEVIVLRFRRHGRRLLLPVICMVVLAGLAGYWVGAFAEGWQNVTAAIAAVVLGVVLGLLPVLGWLTQRVTVTSRRVILRRGIFSRQRSEVALLRVREVRTRRGLLQRMCGAGEIDLSIGAERTVLHDVPAVAATADAIQELVERNYAHASRTAPPAATVPPAVLTVAPNATTRFADL